MFPRSMIPTPSCKSPLRRRAELGGGEGKEEGEEEMFFFFNWKQ